MNFGFYVSNLKKDSQSIDSFGPAIDLCMSNGTIKDASVFFDTSGGSFPELRCGTFNSTDLAHFKGSLFFIEQNLIRKIANTINDIDIYLGYGFGQRDVLNILFLLGKKNVNVICRTKNDAKDIYRITGVDPLGICETPEEIITIMKENSHENRSA